jgi:DNA topoisomerase-1
MVVGFRISPVLWKRFTYGKACGKGGSLSAGRCQIPCLKIIYDNELSIRDHLKGDSDGASTFRVFGRFSSKKITFVLRHEFTNREGVVSFFERMKENGFECNSKQHIFDRDKPREVSIMPPKPLTTSRLQQACSNEMSMSPKDTMSCAQKLYEHGLITYMRTDASHYSSDFIDTVKIHIKKKFNSDRYVSPTLFLLSSVKSNSSDETSSAHESIRPTNIKVETIEDMACSGFTPREIKLYKLIWRITMETCMSSAVYSKMKCKIYSPLSDKWVFIHDAVKPVFMGWKAVKYGVNVTSECLQDDETEEIEDDMKGTVKGEYEYLSLLKPGQDISFEDIFAEERVVKPPLHYTEAKLVQILEAKGIGRPSTFSSLVDKIQDRGYVAKTNVPGETYVCENIYMSAFGKIECSERDVVVGGEKNKLVIQPIGEAVMLYLDEHFSDLFNYDYTKQMEDDLENIANGFMKWTDPCNCIVQDIDRLLVDMKSYDKEKYNVAIDEKTNIVMGRYGPVIKNTEVIDGENKVTFTSVVDTKEDEVRVCETSEWGDNPPVIKKGRFGLYVEWGTSKISLKGFGNRPPENISLDEIRDILESHKAGKGPGIVRQLDSDTSVRRGKAESLYIFYQTKKMKKPKFFRMPKGVNDENVHELDAAVILDALDV